MNYSFDALQTALRAHPRVELLDGPTPIQYLANISQLKQVNACKIYVKRDDLIGLGGGGSKLRKLEFLLAHAKAKGHNAVVAWGGRQSNTLRLTAAAAAKLGMRCEIILTPGAQSDDHFQNNGNALLDGLFGARLHFLDETFGAQNYAKQIVEGIKFLGYNAFLMPMGASNGTGALGYAACAAEILDQSRAMKVDFARVIVPNGSGGTQAGLIAGFAIAASNVQVQGFSVLSPYIVARDSVLEKARETLALLKMDERLADPRVSIDATELGDGYGITTPSSLNAARLLARNEGLLLDPVYGAKAFAGLLESIAREDYKPGTNLLFVMTGGLPAIFAYREAYS